MDDKQKLTVEDLREAYRAALRALHDSDCAMARFQYLKACYLRGADSPGGYDLDLFGDGTLKPVAQCQPHPKP